MAVWTCPWGAWAHGTLETLWPESTAARDEESAWVTVLYPMPRVSRLLGTAVSPGEAAQSCFLWGSTGLSGGRWKKVGQRRQRKASRWGPSAYSTLQRTKLAQASSGTR